jgi:hypothetical protein
MAFILQEEALVALKAFRMGISYACFTLVITWIAAILRWMISEMTINTCSTLTNVWSIAKSTVFVTFSTSTSISISKVSISTVLGAGSIEVDEPF